MKYLLPVRSSLITCCLVAPLLTTSQASAREVCQLLESDPDGDGWGWEMDASCRVTAETGNVPSFQHPRTGLNINIERIFWVWDDFANKTISECRGYIVDPGSSSDRCSTCANTESVYQHLTDGAGVFQTLAGARDQPARGNMSGIDNSMTNNSANRNSNGTTNNAAMNSQMSRQVLASANFRWNVDNNGVYSGALPIEVYGERTAQGVRFWQEGVQGQIGFYTFCEAIPGSMGAVTNNNQTPVVDNNQPTVLTTPQPACIDTDGDGWGWNGSDTCIP